MFHQIWAHQRYCILCGPKQLSAKVHCTVDPMLDLVRMEASGASNFRDPVPFRYFLEPDIFNLMELALAGQDFTATDVFPFLRAVAPNRCEHLDDLVHHLTFLSQVLTKSLDSFLKTLDLLLLDLQLVFVGLGGRLQLILGRRNSLLLFDELSLKAQDELRLGWVGRGRSRA